MRFVKVSVQTLAIVAASVLVEDAPKNPSQAGQDELRRYLAQNDTKENPNVDPNDPKKPKRNCMISVI